MEFVERMAALGLRLPPDEVSMKASSAALRTERPYSQEPLAGFQLDPAHPAKASR